MTPTVRQPSEPETASALRTLGSIVDRFALGSLAPALTACQALAAPGAPLDIAVLGQFKAGKSSMLNAIVGLDLLPVGVLPVTAVVTRIEGGEALRVLVSRLDGTVAEVEPLALADYVAEAKNPGNVKGIAAVDVETRTLLDLPGLRLVDTPGLGSTHAHNTQSTLAWIPNAAAAIVAVSVERPFSEEDRRLVESLRPHAPRIVVVLTKVDLVSEAEREQVRAFVADALRPLLGGGGGGAGPVIASFSARQNTARWVADLRDAVLAPIAGDAGRERSAALAHKLIHLTRAARGYLEVALRAAENVGRERGALRTAVIDESVKESVIANELALAADSVIDSARPAYEKVLTPQSAAVQARVVASLGEMKTWRGHLGKQAERFREFLRDRMIVEMTPLESEAAPVAAKLVEEAELRFRRIAEAFRDRLSRNVSRSLGVTLSPVTWEPARVGVIAPPVTIGPTFMTHWDLFWWLLPMPVVGGLFRWHCRRKVPWEVWINMLRLAGGWFVATADAVEAVQKQAAAWVHTELQTLAAMLSRSDDEAETIRAALAELDAVEKAMQ